MIYIVNHKNKLTQTRFSRGLNNKEAIMEAREILLYFAIKFKGDWNKIYEEVAKKEKPDFEEAKKVISENNSNYITILDAEYPESLKNGYKPPFVLFYIGDISLISDKNNKIAVVGSRRHSNYGKEMTYKLVQGISKDFVIISGLALGIDACAHRAAIESGGKTIAVLGNGINFHYIEKNKDIYEECKKNHLVISEYPDLTPPNKDCFPIRNRIIANLCNNLLITEGKVHSGTQITALLMVQKSGNVCCVPTKAGEDSICNYLIKEGAYLVETPEDIYLYTGTVAQKPIFEK